MQANRYQFLDGMRGIAALFVVVRHTGEFWNFEIFRSYLAVDLFFILSGFVIGHAYDKKLRNRTISASEFMRIRLIRLYPVFLFSLLIALAAFFCVGPSNDNFKNFSKLEILRMVGLSALFLPSYLPGSLLLFPINVPYWSLFFELLANILYASIINFLNHSRHIAIVGFCGVLIILSAYLRGHLDSGFRWGYLSIFIGLSRSIFGIFMGLLIYRKHGVLIGLFGKFISPWVTICAVCAGLSFPSIGRFNGIVDLFFVLIIFPLIVVYASQSMHTKLESVLVMLGSISYPVYVLHEPVGKLLLFQWPEMIKQYAPFSGLSLIFLLGIAAIVIEKWYDIPLRRILSNRRRKVSL